MNQSWCDSVETKLAHLQHEVKTIMATLDQLQAESAALKGKLDNFVKDMSAQVADLKAQIAALTPDPAAQAKIDATFASIEASIADITPAAPPAGP